MSLQTIDRQLHELGQHYLRSRSASNSSAARSKPLRPNWTTHQEDQQAAAARRDLEHELAEGEAQIRNKRMRLNLVRNDKELQALGHEVESLKETNQRLEAELLAPMEGGRAAHPANQGTDRTHRGQAAPS